MPAAQGESSAGKDPARRPARTSEAKAVPAGPEADTARKAPAAPGTNGDNAGKRGTQKGTTRTRKGKPGGRRKKGRKKKGREPEEVEKVKIDVVGLGEPVEVPKGETLYDGAKQAHMNLFWGNWAKLFNCRGMGHCPLCKVQVIEGADTLGPRTKKEEKRLAGKPDDWRLACQIDVSGPIKIDPFPKIPVEDQVTPEALAEAKKIRARQQKEQAARTETPVAGVDEAPDAPAAETTPERSVLDAPPPPAQHEEEEAKAETPATQAKPAVTQPQEPSSEPASEPAEKAEKKSRFRLKRSDEAKAAPETEPAAKDDRDGTPKDQADQDEAETGKPDGPKDGKANKQAEKERRKAEKQAAKEAKKAEKQAKKAKGKKDADGKEDASEAPEAAPATATEAEEKEEKAEPAVERKPLPDDPKKRAKELKRRAKERAKRAKKQKKGK